MRLTATVLCLALLAAPALAQDATPPAAKSPMADAQKPKDGKSPTLSQLYDDLARTKDDDEAARLARRIAELQLRSGSDTTDLLMRRAMILVTTGKPEIAITLLSAVIEEQPDYVEAWNRRALVHSMKNEYLRSAYDLAETLKRDPKRYSAWSALGTMLDAIGSKKHAHEAFKRSLDLNPHQPDVQKQLDSLKPTVEGRDI